jgi:hypothetical protein
MTNEERIKQLEKIRGLLDKAESTEFPEEARLLSEKAQDLMTKYALTDHDLRLLSDPTTVDIVETREVKVFAPYSRAKGHVLSAAAKGNGCKVVFDSTERKRSEGNYRVMYLTGFSRDVDNAEMLYTSLLVQATKELLTTKRPEWEHGKTWSNSFLIGYATEVGDRLRQRRRVVAQETVVIVDGAERNLLPVLASRTAKVEEAYEKRWGGHLRSGPASQVRGGGYGAGRTAGARANVGDPAVGNRRALAR